MESHLSSGGGGGGGRGGGGGGGGGGHWLLDRVDSVHPVQSNVNTLGINLCFLHMAQITIIIDWVPALSLLGRLLRLLY